MDIGKGVADAFKVLFVGTIIGILCTLGFGGLALFDYFTDDVYEVKGLVVPDIHVTTVNGVSDTTYVYTFE